jgi:predicted protein tyrosine phosphatase
MQKVLFVCSANKDRSKTAEDHFSEVDHSRMYRSAGTNHKICFQEGTTALDQELVDWSELIIVMENKHLDWIYNNLNATGKDMKVLHIKDIYPYMDKNLIDLLSNKCERLLVDK